MRESDGDPTGTPGGDPTSTPGGDTSIAGELERLVRTLEDLQRELEPGDRRELRPSSPDESRRFTNVVTIHALILVLETNVRALTLVQRTLRLAEDGDRSDSDLGPVRRRSADLTREALSRLDVILADVDDAVAGEPTDEDARDLLRRARALQSSIDANLVDEAGPTGCRSFDDDRRGSVPVDVEAELAAIKDQVDRGNEGGSDDRNGDDTDGDSGDGTDGDTGDDTERS